jgi:hypothetical protein
MRTTVLAALLALATSACLRGTGTGDVDASSNGMTNNGGADGNTGGSNNNTPDAGNNNTPDAGNNQTPDAGTMSGPPCINKNNNYSSGHHYPGQDCNGFCHNHGFTLAGTLYTSATGSTPIAGATIVAKDAANHTIQMLSGTNGNFYTTSSVQFPVTVYATECQISQTVSQMQATVLSSSNGGCNASGCHTTGSQGHVHLP